MPSSDFLALLAPGNIVAVVIVVAMLAYALTGGADFGGGVLDLLATGPRAGAQRRSIARAIGPIWEANHVWLLVVLVLMFVAFPTAFAAIMTALHLPMLLMLTGITLRGSAFVFRAYGPDRPEWRRWGLVFGAASAVTPILLGVVFGAISSGRITLGLDGAVKTDFVSEWLTPFPWATGLMLQSLFAFLAATYLAVEEDDPELRNDFRRMAVRASYAFFGTALLAAITARTGAPHLWATLAGSYQAWAMQAVLAGVAIGAIVALEKDRFQLARVLAGAQVTLVVLGWAASQAGWILVGQIPLAGSAAPDGILIPVILALVAGLALLIPTFVLLFWLFHRPSRSVAARTERMPSIPLQAEVAPPVR